jgi:ATP-binding cassette, subfamily B, bacterial MsbA
MAADPRRDAIVDSLTRLIPFVWPHRRKLLLSIFFGLLVALLWGANLSAILPVVRVLMEGKDLHVHVDEQIAGYGEQIAQADATIQEIEARIAEVTAAEPVDEAEHVRLMNKRVREESAIVRARKATVGLNWLKHHVMPLVPHNQFQTFTIILIGVLIATLLKGVFIFIQDMLVGSITELVTMSVSKQLFRKALMLDYQTLARDGTADLMSRFTYDIQMMGTGLSLLAGRLVREPLKAITCVIFALLVNWRLTLLSMVFVPLMGYIFYRYGRLLKRASQRMMESMSRIYKVLEETFDGLKVVIAFDGVARHRKQFHQEHKTYYRKAMRVVQIDALTKPTTELLGMLAIFGAMLPGAYLVLRQKTEIWGVKLTVEPMDIAQLCLLYAMLAGVLDPFRKLTSVYSRLKRSTAAIDRIFAFMDQVPEIADPVDPVALPRLSKALEFHEVTFNYPTRELASARKAALDDVTLTINAGEVVAFVGENGCGKSTLINLLPRFFDPQRGEVRIDGVPIKQARLRDLRQQIGLVTQETLLFDDTLLENIRYGKMDADVGEVKAAARQAHVSPFVEDLPQGLETCVGEKGRELSGGQRQRVALARAILRDPAILILDEATSAVDAMSEQLIHQALEAFVPGRTVLLVTHTMSSSILRLITRIVVMHEGRIVATGTHDELLAECPQYQRLYKARSQQPEDHAHSRAA